MKIPRVTVYLSRFIDNLQSPSPLVGSGIEENGLFIVLNRLRFRQKSIIFIYA